MATPTLKDAHELIARMKTSLKQPHGCPTCERVSWEEKAGARKDEITPANGWEPFSDVAGFFKRCDACRGVLLFPWAGRLDAERVLAHMKTKSSAWALNELEALI